MVDAEETLTVYDITKQFRGIDTFTFEGKNKFRDGARFLRVFKSSIQSLNNPHMEEIINYERELTQPVNEKYNQTIFGALDFLTGGHANRFVTLSKGDGRRALPYVLCI